MTGRLADILPDREWISLTEAATALAFGEVFTGQAFSTLMHNVETSHARENNLSAQEALRSAAEQGYSLGILEGFPSDLIARSSTVREHVDQVDRNRREREESWSALYACMRSILESAHTGRVRLKGKYPGQDKHEIIDASDAAEMQSLRDFASDLDTLLVKQTFAEVVAVKVERSGLVECFDKEGQPDYGASSEPEKGIGATIADENRCRAALLLFMQNNPIPTKSKAVIREEIGIKLPDRAFERAWANAIADAKVPDWKKAGRKKKSPHP